MRIKKKKPNISGRFFYNLLFVAIVSISLIGFMWLRSEYLGFKEESERMREQFLISHKTMIKTEVDKAAAYIDFKEAQIEDQLRESIKNRAYEAFEIAQKSVDERHGLVVITGSSALISEYWQLKGIKKL